MARLQLESDNLELELQNQLANASKEARGALHERNENAQLKAMLQEGMQDVHQLEQNVARQLSELVQSVPSFRAMTTRVLPFDMAVDNSIFKNMAHSVDDQYTDMGRVLRRAGVVGLSSDVVESYVSSTRSVYTGNEVGDMLKFRARIVTPFKKGTLEKALWGGIETGGGVTFEPGQDSCEPVSFGTSSRVAIQKNEITIDGLTCIMRMVTKQFVESHRVVQVWNMLADWAVGAGCQVRTQEYGWGYIQPLDGNSTVTVGCILMTPTVDGMISSRGCEKVKSLTKLYQKMVMSRLQSLENQTMDEIVQEKDAAGLCPGLVSC
ncbi:hypothetical protein V7S43_003992 [Phytophthora oleae]|uniref:Uncharacterized protein n=1 Tax=Phytophthora oleae TaxID=2107226 RepID=A0ABD3FWK7_9STRA